VRVLQAIQSERFWHTSFRAWVYRIAHNRVVDHYRRSKWDGLELEDDERLGTAEVDPARKVAERLFHRQLGTAIQNLTLDQQQVLALRFGEGMTAREVAAVIDKTVGAVEALQHRALAALRRILEKEFNEQRHLP
jgi:RNA polymerase sigma-70 factor (ECF subfamily)